MHKHLEDHAVVDDASWFLGHPERAYRLRLTRDSGHLIAVRKFGTLFLRAEVADGWADLDGSESAAERAWWRAAWPDLDLRTRNQMAARARRGAGGRRP